MVKRPRTKSRSKSQSVRSGSAQGVEELERQFKQRLASLNAPAARERLDAVFAAKGRSPRAPIAGSPDPDQASEGPFQKTADASREQRLADEENNMTTERVEELGRVWSVIESAFRKLEMVSWPREEEGLALARNALGEAYVRLDRILRAYDPIRESDLPTRDIAKRQENWKRKLPKRKKDRSFTEMNGMPARLAHKKLREKFLEDAAEAEREVEAGAPTFTLDEAFALVESRASQKKKKKKKKKRNNARKRTRR